MAPLAALAAAIRTSRSMRLRLGTGSATNATRSDIASPCLWARFSRTPNKPLRDWFRVTHLMLTSKKRISALQIHRLMEFGSYHTAHLMCSKIRVAPGNVEFKQFIGYVEVDETYIGGKSTHRHKNKRGGSGGVGGRGPVGKSIIAGAIKRKGNVVPRVMENTGRATLNAFVREAVSTKVSLLSTDERPDTTSSAFATRMGLSVTAMGNML